MVHLIKLIWHLASLMFLYLKRIWRKFSAILISNISYFLFLFLLLRESHLNNILFVLDPHSSLILFCLFSFYSLWLSVLADSIRMSSGSEILSLAGYSLLMKQHLSSATLLTSNIYFYFFLEFPHFCFHGPFILAYCFMLEILGTRKSGTTSVDSKTLFLKTPHTWVTK